MADATLPIGPLKEVLERQLGGDRSQNELQSNIHVSGTWLSGVLQGKVKWVTASKADRILHHLGYPLSWVYGDY